MEGSMARLNWGKRFSGMTTVRTEAKGFPDIPEIEAKDRRRQLRDVRRDYKYWAKTSREAVTGSHEADLANELAAYFRARIKDLGGNV
jgi:hypothetical protein